METTLAGAIRASSSSIECARGAGLALDCREGEGARDDLMRTLDFSARLETRTIAVATRGSLYEGVARRRQPFRDLREIINTAANNRTHARQFVRDSLAESLKAEPGAVVAGAGGIPDRWPRAAPRVQPTRKRASLPGVTTAPAIFGAVLKSPAAK
jgi:hypothetical protein